MRLDALQCQVKSGSQHRAQVATEEPCGRAWRRSEGQALLLQEGLAQLTARKAEMIVKAE